MLVELPMSSLPPILIFDNGDGDEPVSNHSGNRHFSDVLAVNLGRRQVLKGGLAASVASLFAGAGLTACATNSAGVAGGRLLGFSAVAISDADTVRVPPGCRAQPLLPWGTPITGRMPAFDPLKNSGADQASQMGSHHDGMHFFPIEGRDPFNGSSDDGLLVMNHEYVEPRFMHASAVGQKLDRDAVPALVNGKRVADECLKELNGHGVSVVRIRRGENGRWEMVSDARNRRITGLTPMEIAGPVRGSDYVRTRFSPDGLWFDRDGRLWIQTDISESAMNKGDYAQFGNNQMLCADLSPVCPMPLIGRSGIGRFLSAG